MADAIKRIPVSPDGELARELQTIDTSAGAVVFDTGIALYEVFVSGRAPERPDDERVARSSAGIRAAAGSWKDIDVAALEAYQRKRRKLHTRPPVDL